MNPFSAKIFDLILLSVLLCCLPAPLEARQGKEKSNPDPALVAASPLGGERGSDFEVLLQGRDLDGAYAAWFECDDLEASIEKVEISEPPAEEGGSKDDQYGKVEKENQREHRVRLRVSANPKAALGLHGLRLVTPHGTTNALPLQDKIQTNSKFQASNCEESDLALVGRFELRAILQDTRSLLQQGPLPRL